ncbi:unnamed protein product [Rhizophagus irregularis]|nr:unnamed protein product [Rhizophagus irregularis]
MLTRTCKSIKELKFYTYGNDYNCGIAKLIENQKGLFSVNFLNDFYDGGSSRKIIENSLIKHADTIQYFSICEQPETKVLTSLVNLRILELISANPYIELRWDNIKDLTLPSLHTLIASSIPINYLDFLEIYKAKKAINNPESVGNIPENVVNNPENIVKNSESKATSILNNETTSFPEIILDVALRLGCNPT